MPNGEFKPNPEWVSWRYLVVNPEERFTLYGKQEDITKLEKLLIHYGKEAARTSVFVVMLAKSTPYDLQFVCKTEQEAFDFARQFRESVIEEQRHGDSVAGDTWIELSTGHHWFHRQLGWALRVSEIIIGVPRAQQPGDDNEALSKELKEKLK